MNILENVQYAVVGKFTYGWPKLDELRKIISQQRIVYTGFNIWKLQLYMATINKTRSSCAKVKFKLILWLNIQSKVKRLGFKIKDTKESDIQRALKEVERQTDISPKSNFKGVEFIEDKPQQITLKLCLQDPSMEVMVTLIYAKSDANQRLELWNDMYQLANNFMSMDGWRRLHCGDERIGNDWRFACTTLGKKITRCNGRVGEGCNFKRLDKMLVNHHLQEQFGYMEMEHEARTGSDHAPILCSFDTHAQNFVKPFRFQKIWTEHLVPWKWLDKSGLHKRDQTLSLPLRTSQRERRVEEIVRLKKDIFEEDPSHNNRGILQQRDRNTTYFHNLVERGRNRLKIKRIKDMNDNWIEDEEKIVTEALESYKNQFSQEEESTKEVKEVVFKLNSDSFSGPHGFFRFGLLEKLGYNGG
ncbi:hypothetical protein H5410_040827 [Solanum commersonii]|uniref:Uncharacterized protein n=1 Tax=Solanum commersonii TaxID=4109 RepID=A0A9J5XQ26_SOLCO|nr:hypothetical protein H5410_040827 [Solanum commersonii]